MTLPGHHIRRWASRVFSPLTMARVIDPMLADLQFEYAQARAAGSLWRARWIQLTGYVTCARAVALCASQAAWKVFRSPSVGDQHAVRRVTALTALSVVVVTALFAWPFWALLLQNRHAARVIGDDPATRLWLLALLLPQALPVAIPVALMLAVSVAIGSRQLSPRVTAAALGLALCGSLASFGATGWGAPLANQEFQIRTTPAGSDIPKGAAELTLGQIRADRSRTLPMLRDSPAVMARIFIAQSDLGYHRRYALPAASIVLVLFLLARRRNANRLLLASQAAIACGIYYGLMVTGDVSTRDGWMNGIAAAWLPNVVYLVAAAALMLRSRRLTVRHADAM